MATCSGVGFYEGSAPISLVAPGGDDDPDQYGDQGDSDTNWPGRKQKGG